MEAFFRAVSLELADGVAAHGAADEDVFVDNFPGEAYAAVFADELPASSGAGAEGEGDVFLIAEDFLPLAVGGVGLGQAYAGDFFADGIEGVLKELTDGVEGISIECLAGEELEEAAGVWAEGSVDVFVGVVGRADVLGAGGGEVPIAADGFPADHDLGGEALAEGGDAVEFVVDPFLELEQGAVGDGGVGAGLEVEAVSTEVDGEGVVFLPMDEAALPLLDAAVAEEDSGGALGVVF